MHNQRFGLRLLGILVTTLLTIGAYAQVNSVLYGKNRIQYRKYDWKFYQTEHFNTYSHQNGLELGKFVAQVAEEELPQLEESLEARLGRKASIIVYNTYEDYKASNIGLGTVDLPTSGGVTKLVNNKLVVYFNGDHAKLRLQIREGIARVLTDNILFGDDLGEIASNQALLDLPKWLTDGYVAYHGQRWSTSLDDELKNVMLSDEYRNFYSFAFSRPELAGHAFWWYIDEKYKRENVAYFFYLARLYKNLNSASNKIAKKKFKPLLEEFMEYQQTKYSNDIRRRKNAPRGRLSVVEDVTKKEIFRFQANPGLRNNDYAYVEYRNGIYAVKLVTNYDDPKTLLKFGVRVPQGDINPNYPILAYDNKGSRLLVIYSKEGKIRMFVYDVLGRIKRFQQEIKGVEQILDAQFMLDANTLILSAVKNGHSDIFQYKIEQERLTQLTNDVYDDVDPTFIAFPNRTGIIFSSNRPGPGAPTADTVIPGRSRFNIYLIDNFNANADLRQISKLTDLKYGNARYPMQYNNSHFTFVADENGVQNRWAGFFSTARNGLDTLYYIGDEILRNPTITEFDSTLNAWQKQEPDSVSFFQVFKDSTYSFPISNYATNLLETRISGDKGTVSETRQEGEYKYLYKLKVDSATLRKRNINPKPTDYRLRTIAEKRAETGSAFQTAVTPGQNNTGPDTSRPKAVFQSEFDDENADSVAAARKAEIAAVAAAAQMERGSMLSNSKLFKYRYQFSADFVLAGISNNILVNRYQPYQFGAGPVQLNNGNDANWSLRAGVIDLMEDLKIIGGARFGFGNLGDKDVFISFQNLRRRVDWGLTYYRSNINNFQNFYAPNNPLTQYSNNVITSIYQVNSAYALNEVKAIRGSVGMRYDRGVIKPLRATTNGFEPDPSVLSQPDTVASTFLARLEYVHDNTLNPAQNIWKGLRWKVYVDANIPVSKGSSLKGKNTYVVGGDARYYYPIYRNFIWATRLAADFSFGNAKMIYYLGGMDGWINPKFNNNNQPDPAQNYAFQSLALNMRGFQQNIANGSNAMVFNSELRFPVFSTLFNKPINNAFLRNFQLTQFIDLGTAWSGGFENIKRPVYYFAAVNNPVVFRRDAGGIGPLAGGYGFGARSMFLGYFIKGDIAWEMNSFFREKPLFYLSLGLDF